MQKNNLYKLISCALLVAVSIVLSRFLSLPAIFGVRIGFGLTPIMLSGLMFGPVYGFITGAIADIVGLFLFPSGGWLPGVTLANSLTGVLPPLFMNIFRFKKKEVNLLLSIMITTYVCLTVMSTYFLRSFFGKGYFALLPARFAAHTVLAPINTFILSLLIKALPKSAQNKK